MAQLDQLERDLDNLAATKGIGAPHRAILSFVQSKIGSTGGNRFLSELNLPVMSALPVESESRFSRGLDGATHSLVYAPILWTWFGVGVAAYRYGVVSESIRQSKSFLALWEEGFDDSLPWVLRLHGVALIDALLVTLIMLTAVASSIVHARLAAREQRLQESICDSYLRVDAYTKAESEDGQLLQTTADVAEAMRRSAEQMTLILESLGDSLVQAEGVFSRLEEAASNVETASVSLATNVTTVSGNIGDLRHDVRDYSLRLATVADELKLSNVSLSDSTEELTITAKAWVDLALGLGGDISKSATEIPLLVDGMKDLVDHMDAAGRDQASTIQQLGGELTALSLVLPQLKEGAQELSRTVGSLQAEDTAAQLARTVATVEVGLREIRATLDGLRFNLANAAVVQEPVEGATDDEG